MISDEEIEFLKQLYNEGPINSGYAMTGDLTRGLEQRGLISCDGVFWRLNFERVVKDEEIVRHLAVEKLGKP